MIAAGLYAAVGSPAHADDASPWSDDGHAAIRLVAGSSGGSALRAGIEIKLDGGWKTYWRYPGDSGVPPRFDFAGSQNLASAKVLYPVPHLFTDETGNSLGYKDDVVFPLQVKAKQPGQPVVLRVTVDYAVCEKLCVPAKGAASLSLTGAASANDALLDAAEALVPKQVPAAELGLTARRVNDAAKPLVAVDLKAAAGEPVEIFVEGPTAEWALPIPKPAQGAPPGHQQFGFELDGLPPGVSPKGSFELTFTVVKGGKAYEARTHLD